MPDKAYDFDLTIDGIPLSDIGKAHLALAEYEENLEETSQFEFTVVPSEQYSLKEINIALRSSVIFKLGQWNELVQLFSGDITQIIPEFPANAPSRLRVICSDLSYRFKRVPVNNIWTGVTLKSIATELCAKHGLKLELHPGGSLKGTKLHDDYSDEQEDESLLDSLIKSAYSLLMDYKLQDDESVKQIDQTDWEILDILSKRGNYNLFVNGRTVFMVDDNFLSSNEFSNMICPDYALPRLKMVYRPTQDDLSDAGAVVLQGFSPEVGTHGQRSSVEVREWASVGEKGEKFGTADLAHEPSSGENYTEIVVQSETIETLRIYGEAAKTSVHAKSLAQAELRRRAARLVEGAGTLANGFPLLRMGQKQTIQVNDIYMSPWGEKFTGEYIISAVRHVIDSQGMCTSSFDIRRDGLSKV